MRSYKSRGFTLIELSIVLIVIGLIVGAVVLGKDLIKSSAIGATITQLDKYNAAVAAFSDKYGYLPGNILSTKAQNFGLYYCSGSLSNTMACGDGGGVIRGSSTSTTADGGSFGGEIAMFFLHLSQTGLIDGFYGAGGADVTISGATTTVGAGGSSSSFPAVTANTTIKTTSEIIPMARMGGGNYFTIASINRTNYYVLAGISSLNTTGTVTSTNNLSPTDAYMFDSKIDDGLPASGTVYALDTATTALSANSGAGITTQSANSCVTGTAYNIKSSNNASTLLCSLRINMVVH